MEENKIKFECNKEQIMNAFEEVKDFVNDMRKNNLYLSNAERLAFQTLRLYINDSTPNEKIRTKIEELKKHIDYQPLDNKFTYKEVIQYGIDILQELFLEEE